MRKISSLWTEKILVPLVLVLLLLLSTVAVLPPRQSDAFVIHAALPNYYINMGRIVPNPYHFHSYFPANTEMLVMWALLFKSEVAAMGIPWCFCFSTLGVSKTIHKRFSRACNSSYDCSCPCDSVFFDNDRE